MTATLDPFFAASLTTGAIRVQVQPQYDEERSQPGDGYYIWQYHIRIENHGSQTVRLTDRRWLITDGRGHCQEVQGEGVVGEQPVIEPGGSFDYVSGCPLSTASGMMEGSYGMETMDGQRFRVAIPAFDLLSPASRKTAN